MISARRSRTAASASSRSVTLKFAPFHAPIERYPTSSKAAVPRFGLRCTHACAATAPCQRVRSQLRRAGGVQLGTNAPVGDVNERCTSRSGDVIARSSVTSESVVGAVSASGRYAARIESQSICLNAK